MNKRGQSALTVIVGVIAILVIAALFLGMWIMGTYNSLVSLQTNTDAKWANVQSAYQRRADLIPNLVETVKGYKDFEHDTMVEVTEMRSQAGQAKIDVGSAKTPEQLQAAMSSLDNVLSRLMVVVEKYPDLKASTNFLALQDELAGTENRVKVERDNFNAACQTYNVAVRVFPANILANMFGFDPRTMFVADEGSQKAPIVSFAE